MKQIFGGNSPSAYKFAIHYGLCSAVGGKTACYVRAQCCPNITGAVSGSYGGYIDSPNVSSTGSLKAIEKATYVAQPSGAQMRYTLAFDASDSSNIYSSDSVQPEAFQVLIIIKI